MYTHTRIYIYTHTHTHTHIYIHIYAYIHIYTYTHTPAPSLRPSEMSMADKAARKPSLLMFRRWRRDKNTGHNNRARGEVRTVSEIRVIVRRDVDKDILMKI